MRQLTTIIVGLMLLSLNLLAQDKEITDEARIAALSEELSNAYSAISTIRCDFTQEKMVSLLDETIKSNGTLFYSVEMDSLAFETSKGVTTMTANNNQAFGEISKMLRQNREQNSFVNESNFIVQFFENSEMLILRLTPKNKRLSRLLSSINLYCNMKDKGVRRMEIVDANHDITTINLYSVVVK